MFDDVTAAVGLGRSSRGLTGWGTTFFDADNDGDLDLYCTNGYTSPVPDRPGTCVPQPDRLLINERGRFTDESFEMLQAVTPSAGRGLVAADLDRDGDLDLVRTANNGEVTVLENRLASGHWLVVRPAGAAVVGARVVVTCGGREQIRVVRAGVSYLSSEPREVHFGLGSATVVPRLEVTWPDGTTRIWRNVPADERFVAEPAS